MVIGMNRCESTEQALLRFPWIFKDSREPTGCHDKCGAMPESDDPISGQPNSREHAPSRRKDNSSRAPADVSKFVCVAANGRNRLHTPVQEC